jgi:hypothetical protein
MLKCLERIIEYLNKQAYIQIALRGKNFCMASIDGVTSILSNPVRYSIVSGVGSIMTFISELLITAGGTVLFWVLITFKESIRNNIMEPIFMLIVVGLGSLVIAKFFMSVYSVSMDTILACFIADEINQKGKSGRALYAPQEMVELMEN